MLRSKLRPFPLAATAVALALAVIAAALTLPSGTAPPAPSAPARWFAPGSVWNAPLPADAPLDASSSELAGTLAAEVRREVAAGSGPWINTTAYSTPVYTVGPGQPTVRVQLDEHSPALQAALDAVPLPPGARPAQGSDAQLTVWQPSTDTLWEFWRLSKRTDGWHASWAGAMHDVSTSPGSFTADSWPGAQPWWGATATSLPLVGGMITLDDLRRGRIDHALAVGLPAAIVRGPAYAWPAQRTDGTATDPASIPEGARFRLDPALDLSTLGLSPAARMIAEAAQRYGIVVRDRSGDVTLYGEDPTHTGSNPYPAFLGGRSPFQVLQSLPWDRLQLLQMRLSGGG